MIKDYIILATNNVKNRGIRSWLAMLGIFIGIAALVSLISLGNGLQQAVTGQFSSLSANTLIITNAETGFGPPGSTAIKKLTEHDLEIIQAVKEVKLAIPRIIKMTKVEYEKEAKFSFIGSLPEIKEQTSAIYEIFNLETDEGKLLKPEDKGKILLGNSIVKEFHNIELGKTLKIGNKNFEVIGILKKTGAIQMDRAIYMNENDMKEILNIKDEMDIIVVQIRDYKKTTETAEEIKKVLRKDRKEKAGNEDFSVQTPMQVIGTINTILTIINIIVSGIAAISLIIGGIGIGNTMYTSVLERTKDIGIMKAIGAQNKDIAIIFIIESAILGLLGGIFGTIIGLILAFGISYIVSTAISAVDLQVTISIPLIIIAPTFALAIGLISGIIPAMQASKLNPVEALRK